MSRRSLSMLLTAAFLGGLVWYSAYLAANRIYQVDECQNLYMAKVLAAGQTSEFFSNASLFLLGPLSWLTKALKQSADIFASARLLFLGVFWLNIFLMALITGRRLRSPEGLIALAAAATLAPLWDYGFEVRHDNLILTGILLIWWLVRSQPMGVPSYLGAGAITVALLFIAVKSAVYVLPLAAAVLVFPPSGHARSRPRLALAWIGGALLALLAVRACYGTGGKWEIYLSVFHDVAKYSAGAGTNGRFPPWFMLERLPGQLPALLALTTAAVLAVLVELFRRGRVALTWNGNLPEFCLVAGALAGLFLNPTPFPYNSVHLVPYAFLLVFPYARNAWEKLQSRPGVGPMVVGVVFVAHLVPFGLSARRHLDFPNYRQKALMHLAETLTDGQSDSVYDGIGMVLTRPSIHFNWYLHSLNIQRFINGSGSSVREMLAARPAAVLIQSYRTDWLTKEDHDFIQSRYVPLADDFWVLGRELPSGGGDVEIIHPGRYCITSQDSLSGAVHSVDGKTCSTEPVELTTGFHHIETTSNQKLRIFWVGPKLDQVPSIGSWDHRFLFVNWY